MSTAAVIARISRSSTSLPFLGSLALPVPDCSFYTVTTYVRCYAPWYKSVIQLSVGLYGIHYRGPVPLGSVHVYPVETSTSLYNLYTYIVHVLFSLPYLPLPCTPHLFLALSLSLSLSLSHTHTHTHTHTLSISEIIISMIMFWYLMSTMEATDSRSGRMSVGPNTTPRLLAFMRLRSE